MNRTSRDGSMYLLCRLSSERKGRFYKRSLSNDEDRLKLAILSMDLHHKKGNIILAL